MEVIHTESFGFILRPFSRNSRYSTHYVCGILRHLAPATLAELFWAVKSRLRWPDLVSAPVLFCRRVVLSLDHCLRLHLRVPSSLSVFSVFLSGFHSPLYSPAPHFVFLVLSACAASWLPAVRCASRRPRLLYLVPCAVLYRPRLRWVAAARHPVCLRAVILPGGVAGVSFSTGFDCSGTRLSAASSACFPLRSLVAVSVVLPDFGASGSSCLRFRLPAVRRCLLGGRCSPCLLVFLHSSVAVLPRYCFLFCFFC